MNIEIIFEDDFIVIINKPSGIAAQQTKTGELSVYEYFESKYEPINRLDQRVSGLMILAKTKEIFYEISALFINKKIKKNYRAIVAQKPEKESDTLTHWILKNSKAQKSKAYKEKMMNSKQAILHYNVEASSIKYHLLNIKIDTGRFHQIRAQLAAINSPIVGDVKYGFKRTTEDGSIFLQCYHLEFNHPKTNAVISCSINVPEIWKKFGF